MQTSTGDSRPEIMAFFDDATNTVSYVVQDPRGSACAIIDSVMGFDAPSGRTSTKHADQICDFIQTCKLDVIWILETHVHADHLTGAPYLRERLGGNIAISDQITVVQKTFGAVFNERPILRGTAHSSIVCCRTASVWHWAVCRSRFYIHLDIHQGVSLLS